MNREKVIVRTGIIGIVANVFLAAFKAAVGLMTNSIAIILDAVNNISDAGSSLITIIGTKLAGKDADKKHPFGYGRIEYLSAMLISGIVLYAGVTSFTESVKKIIHPELPEYNAAALIIVGVAVVVKIVLGRYVKNVGVKVNSDSLVNSGEDATLDSIISASTLVAAGIFILFGVSLEAWLGAIISLVIIKSGIEMLRETVSRILGEPNDPKFTQEIKATIREFPEVYGAYDLILHNYGPDTWQGSVHVEVDDTMTADELDTLTRKIQASVFEKHRVLLTAVSVYSINCHDEEIMAMKQKIKEIIAGREFVRGVHGFYINKHEKQMRFDVVVSFDAPSRREVCNGAVAAVKDAFPDYDIEAAMDADFSEV